jgi:hypothetical protein
MGGRKLLDGDREEPSNPNPTFAPLLHDSSPPVFPPISSATGSKESPKLKAYKWNQMITVPSTTFGVFVPPFSLVGMQSLPWPIAAPGSSYVVLARATIARWILWSMLSSSSMGRDWGRWSSGCKDVAILCCLGHGQRPDLHGGKRRRAHVAGAGSTVPDEKVGEIEGSEGGVSCRFLLYKWRWADL